MPVAVGSNPTSCTCAVVEYWKFVGAFNLEDAGSSPVGSTLRPTPNWNGSGVLSRGFGVRVRVPAGVSCAGS